MADQLAAQFLPFHGHKLVKTPNLSRLAAEGCRLRERLFDEPALRARPRHR